MAVATNVLLASATAAQGIAGAGQAYNQSQALIAQGDYQASQARINAANASAQAEDAIQRGEREAARMTTESRKIIATQRATAAATGQDPNSPDALALQEETALIGAADATKIRTDAWREAWGFKSQALNTKAQGEMAKRVSKTMSRNTLITGGVDLLSSGLKAGYYYDRK